MEDDSSCRSNANTVCLGKRKGRTDHSSASESGGRTAGDPLEAAKALVGSRIKHIRIDKLLGIGGMGAVYSAFDEVLRRRVAVKAVRQVRRMDPQTRARFLREARLLSKLQHPNICQIHDYIQSADTDFLVLELIRGTDLRAGIRAGIPMAEKLRIAAELLAALIAAHGRGVVHRDLKPDNVMITREGQVKVLDFGIARVSKWPVNGGSEPETASDSGQTAEESSDGVHTQLGAVVGTVEYMSPEQAVGEGGSPSSDIYSCGLVFQELFTGCRPYQEGLTPTAALSRAIEGDTLPIQGLELDLTTLIERMKALVPGDRPSARDAAERLSWIRDRPRRRARRIAAGSAVGLLGCVTLLTTYQAWRIGEEAERANQAAALASREARTAAEVSEFLEGLFRVSDPGNARGNTITAREILDRGAERIRGELTSQPETRARLILTIGRVYRELGLYAEADQLLQEALESSTQVFGPSHLETAAVLVHIGRLRELQGRFDDGVEMLREALRIRQASLPEDHPLVADAKVRLANIHYQQGRYEEAIALYEEALTSIRVNPPDDPVKMVRPLHNLANVYQRQERFDLAIPLYQETLRIMELELGKDHSQIGHPLNNLGMVYSRQGHFDTAIPLFQRALAVWTKSLGPEHHLTTHPLNNLADAYRELGRTDEAIRLYRQVVEIRERTLGRDHPDLALALHGLARALVDRGRPTEALPLLARTLEIREVALEPDHPDLLELLKDYAATLRQVGREEQASELEARR